MKLYWQHEIIWADSWLPDQTSFKICSPVNLLAQDANVCELIDEDTKQWKRDLVFNIFNQHEARQIVNIPISVRLPADKLIWHWERHGQYIVRSAYHMMSEGQFLHTPESSNARNQDIWKAIWKIHLPNCIRNFLWRLARNILPTRSNLGKKGMHIELSCPLCSAENECQNHLFMHCQSSQLVWFTSHLGIHVPPNQDLNTWLLHWLNCSDIRASQVFCCTLWKIWKYRNNVIFNKTSFNPREVAISAQLFIDEFNVANKRVPTGVSRNAQGKRNPPDSGWLKLNVDAGCWKNDRIGFGMLVRDHSGSVSYAATHSDQLQWSPTLAEAMALRWCLSWAKEQSFENLVVETDAEVVVNCFYGRNKLTEIDNIILDRKDLVSAMQNVRIQAVSRCKNSAAHGLVQVAKDIGTHVWFGSIPCQINSIFCNDSSSDE